MIAKAPVPGEVKTRLGAQVGNHVAAGLAASSLLDTLDVCEAVFRERHDRHIALAGDLDAAVRRDDLVERLAGWTLHRQRGHGFAHRLSGAHEDVARAAGASVVQIGMDTPHLPPAELADVAGRVGRDNDAVLGPAEDGGWWVLASTHPRFARALRAVRMSTERTYADTRAALEAAGARIADASVLRDVDTPHDADIVSTSAPRTRFAQHWARAVPTGAGG